MSVFDFPARTSWLLLAITGGAAYAGLLGLGVTFEGGRIALTFTLVAFFLAASFFYMRIRPDRRLAVVTAATAFILAFAATTGVLTYPAAATGAAPRDGMFIAFEHMIGIGSGHSAVGDHELARRLLGFPEDRFAAMMIDFGYPVDRPLRPIRHPDRRPFDELVHRGHW